ncbi:phenylacetate--CoA ligase family protein [Sphingomonas sp. CJ20]
MVFVRPKQLADDSRAFLNVEAQTRTAEEIAALQRAGVAREWARVWDTPLPFYRDKYERTGLRRDQVPALDEIPVTTKKELQANEQAENVPWGSWCSVALEDATYVGASGGTTGRPMLYLRSTRDAWFIAESLRRNFWRYGLRPFSRFTNAWPGGIYSAGGSGDAASSMGVMDIPVGMPFTVDAAVEHLRIWRDMKPHVFMITGSQLLIYEQAAEKLGVDLKAIFGGGTVAIVEASLQFAEPRRRLEARYGCRFINISGASEIPGGAVSDCEHHTGFHTHADLTIAQVCDPITGKEVAPGERGHLVWSCYGTDSFWLRYDVEDWVERAVGECPCGEAGARYVLLGRDGDRVRIGSRQIFPLDVQLALDSMGAPEFQLLNGGAEATHVALKVETNEPDALRDHLATALGVPVELQGVEQNALPRSTFKPRRT